MFDHLWAFVDRARLGRSRHNRQGPWPLMAAVALAFIAMAGTSGRAYAQSLPQYACVQNVSNSEYLTSSASQLANNCQSNQVFQLVAQSGGNYCIQNVSNGQYLENHATQMSSSCTGNNEYWKFTTTTSDGMTVYCIQNQGNSEYLTAHKTQMSSSCGEDQYWFVTDAGFKCIQNIGSSEYLTSKATQMSSTCNGQNQWWKFTQYQNTTYYCIQDVGTLEYLSSHATQMSSTCGNNNRWALSGTWTSGGTMSSTCIKAISTGEYLTNKASSMASQCNSNNQFWNITVAPYSVLAPK